MSRLLAYLPFFKPARSVPPVVSTDEVVPVHLFDDTTTLRDIGMVWTFRFKEVLNPDRLNAALFSLFQKDGWRKLGGRFRRKSDGRLEIHIPCPFTEERPPLHYTKASFDMRLDEHPLASQLPRTAGKVAIYPAPRTFNPLTMGPDTPRKLDDYLYSDSPQFSLHVVTFTDATLVTVSHSHMSADLMGFSAIVHAWSLVLAGQEDTVSRFAGLDEDVMRKLWSPAPREKYLLAGQEVSGWRLAYWGLWALWASWQSHLESHVLCIPRRTMQDIMARCEAQISSTQDRSVGQNLFISQGDVLSAIACRMNALQQPIGSTRTVMTMLALDPRSRVPLAFPKDAVFVQNAPTAVFFGCPAGEARTLPLGELALRCRNAIAAQATKEQVRAYAALSARSVQQNGMNMLFGNKDMSFQLVSNWLKGDLLGKMDFSSAIIQEAQDSETETKRGHPVYFQGTDPEEVDAPLLVSLFVVMAADHNGDTWLSCVLPRKTWQELIEYLDSFAT